MTPAGVLFHPDDFDKPLAWEDVFGFETHPEIEVGCGKGRFLLSRSHDFPDRSFVGIEYSKPYLQTMADRAVKKKLSNIRLARCEAAWFFRECVPDRSVAGFHLLYPDPWPKKRHHKRRLVQNDFLFDLRRVLNPGACLNIATDHEGYFEWMVECFNRWKGTFVMKPEVFSRAADVAPLEGRTNYEIKYLEKGRTLYRLCGRRTGF